MPALLTPASPSVINPAVSKIHAHPGRQRLRCVIVSDHRLFADLLAMTLATAPDFASEVAAIAASAADGILACNTHRPSVVLLDLGLADGQAIHVAEHATAKLPDSQVIVVSRYAGMGETSAKHELISNGIIRAASDFDDLQTILADMIQPGTGRGGGNGSPLGRGRRLATILSRREREVLALIGQRLSSRQIAERLAISLHTINAHRKNIAHKLGIKGANLSLVAFEYREQLRGLRL